MAQASSPRCLNGTVQVISARVLKTNLPVYQDNPIAKLLLEKHYVLFAKTYNTFFFGDVSIGYQMGWKGGVNDFQAVHRGRSG